MSEVQLMIASVVIGGCLAFGYVVGFWRGMRIMRPCDMCETTRVARSHWGISETWCCDDKDGCRARVDKKRPPL